MRSQSTQLRERRKALLRRAEAEREALSGGYASIEGSLGRADDLLALARRATPVAAVGAVALGLVIGPARIVRLVRKLAVPALLIREILGRSAGRGTERGGLFGLFGRRS